MFREIARLLSRNVVIPRRFPARFGGGRIYVSPDAVLGVLRRNLENHDPELFAVAAKLVRPGDLVWDIGANLGLFTFAAAHVAGPSGSVVAVEADAWLVTIIRRSARRRPGGAPVRVLAAAACELPGIVEFHIARHGRASSFVGDAGRGLAGGTRETHTVAAVSLDSLMAELGPPNVVKIDVEGLEGAVLRGASRLLREARPRLYIEVGSPAVDEVHRMLTAADYGIFRIAEGRLVAIERPDWNTVAVPREQVGSLA
jgi:FkbM family methyltransferase